MYVTDACLNGLIDSDNMNENIYFPILAFYQRGGKIK